MGMTDKEKVIKGLECCLDVQSGWKDARYVCPTCTYTDNGIPCETLAPLMEDALALLKAQEPRVMTLYEVAKMAADFQDSMLWFEPKEVDDDMWFMAYAQPVESGETDIHIYEFGNDQPIEAKKYLYGKTWRCWTSRPDEKRRAETPWN